MLFARWTMEDIKTSAGLNCGSAATPDLSRFISSFGPYTLKGKAGEALRKEGFKAADPNGAADVARFDLRTPYATARRTVAAPPAQHRPDAPPLIPTRSIWPRRYSPLTSHLSPLTSPTGRVSPLTTDCRSYQRTHRLAGNGLCSLAEIENFIMSTLISATDADQGRALFDGQ